MEYLNALQFNRFLAVGSLLLIPLINLATPASLLALTVSDVSKHPVSNKSIKLSLESRYIIDVNNTCSKTLAREIHEIQSTVSA